MVRRELGRSGLTISAVGFGAFKIGRNRGVKYPEGYDLPGEDEVAALLDGVVDCGIRHLDTAPSYGLSEARLGRWLEGRDEDLIVSTKVGETFEDGVSTHDFSAAAVRASVRRSIDRLGREPLDLVLVHSDGRDLEILERTPVVGTLRDLVEAGSIRAIGFSGKTVAGAEAALDWADAIMVEYHLEDDSHDTVMRRAADRGVGVLVKKGLRSGHLDPARAIEHVLRHPSVDGLVIGGLNLGHLRANVAIAERVLAGTPPR